MSDPLSVCASVAGLVAISAKIASLAKKLYDSGRDAPHSISRIQAEMEQLHLIFVQVQMLLDGRAKKIPSRRRLRMIPLHHLMTILSGCVLAYSSLDKTLSEVVSEPNPRSSEVAGLTSDSAQSRDNSGSAGSAGSPDAGTLWVHRVKWILWKEAEAAVILADLERHKSSLHIMLTIIQGNSATEAEERLHELIEKISQQISQSNHEVAIQLRELISEHRNGSSPHSDTDTNGVSISPTEDSKPIAEGSTSISASTTDCKFNNNASIRTTASTFPITSVRSRILPPAEKLKNARPYKRLLCRGIDYSSSSVFSKDSQSTPRGGTWSMLSNMSLGDLFISEISVLELPVCLSDLYDPTPYQHSSSKKERRQIFKFSSRGRLHAAIQKGNLFTVRMYLALGADPEEIDADGCPLLVYAAKMDVLFGFKSEIIQLLLDRGAMVGSTDSKGRTPLSYAAGKGTFRIFELLLDRSAVVDSTDFDGRTPLSYAAVRGRPRTCKLLLNRGAIVDSTDSNGRTPLSYAAEQQYLSILCKLLLDRGAIVDSTDSNGRTPLSYAAEHGTSDTCRVLLDRGAICDSTDSNGRTPLSYAAEQQGRTPLSYAAEQQDFSVCELLLDRGAIVDITDSNGRTPLSYAAEHGNPKISKLLLDRSARMVEVLEIGTSGRKTSFWG